MLDLANCKSMWHASKSGKATMERIIGTAGWCTSAIHNRREAAQGDEDERMRDTMVHAYVIRAWRQASV